MADASRRPGRRPVADPWVNLSVRLRASDLARFRAAHTDPGPSEVARGLILASLDAIASSCEGDRQRVLERENWRDCKICGGVVDLTNAIKSGKPVTAQNAARLMDLAAAADVFAAENLTATAQLLRRPIAAGKRFFDVVRDGGSAEDAARKLVEMARRELVQRQALSERLAGRKRPATPSEDLAAPLLDEMG